MTRRRHAQLSLSRLVLYGLVIQQPEELMDPLTRRIDVLLEDESLVDEVLATLRRRYRQSARRGRPGTPAEVVLRMLVLKHLRQWSYDALEREVTANLVYRRFCRIDGGKVPDAKTMVRLGQLVGAKTLRALFDRVVAMAVDEGVSRGTKMRVDTTVVEAPIRYPTDSGLCEDVVRILRRGLKRLVEAGIDIGGRLRDVRRSVSRRMRQIGQALRLRGEQAHEAIKKPYRGLLRITGRMIRLASAAADAAGQQLRSLPDAMRRRVARIVDKLRVMLPRARQVVRQTRDRIVHGITRSADKLISLFEPTAQILRRGKLHQPTELGVLVKVQEAEGGLVTDIHVVPDKADAPLLVPSVRPHRRVFGRPPRVVATDRGFYSNEGVKKIQKLGVRRAVVPKPGFQSEARQQLESQRWYLVPAPAGTSVPDPGPAGLAHGYRRGRAWRAGGQARISRLKHTFGMKRSRYRGDEGTPRAMYWAAIANNLVAIAGAAG